MGHIVNLNKFTTFFWFVIFCTISVILVIESEKFEEKKVFCEGRQLIFGQRAFEISVILSVDVCSNEVLSVPSRDQDSNSYSLVVPSGNTKKEVKECYWKKPCTETL